MRRIVVVEIGRSYKEVFEFGGFLREPSKKVIEKELSKIYKKVPKYLLVPKLLVEVISNNLPVKQTCWEKATNKHVANYLRKHNGDIEKALTLLKR